MSADTRPAFFGEVQPDPTASTSVMAAEADQPLSGLSSGLAVASDWPKSAALLVGDARHPKLLTVLHRYGFRAVAVTTDPNEQIKLSGPFTFVIVSADALTDDEDVQRLRSLRRLFPSARVLLDYPERDRDPEVLVRGVRAGVNDVFDPDDEPAIEAAVLSGIRRAGRHRERVLAIGAHPDDVEIGCGGTLIDHRLRGDRVSILTLSRGAIGGDEHDRVQESMTAAEAVGAQLLLADLPDASIDEGISTIRLIEEAVRVLDPTLVYVHSGHDRHQDHRAVSTATASATRSVRRVFAYESPSATNEFRPTRFVPVDAVVSRKVEVLRSFVSQHGRSYLEPDIVVAGCRYWARHLAAVARYAEPFEVIRSVGDLRLSETAPAPYADLDDDPAVEIDIATPQPPVLTPQR